MKLLLLAPFVLIELKSKQRKLALDRLKAYLHGTTLSHATSLRQAYDMT